MSDHDPNPSTGDDNALFAELLDRAQVVAELDAAQLEAWTSSLFVALDTDELLLGFIAATASQPSPISAAVLAALGYLADDEVARAARQASDRMASQAPESVARIGRARSAQAWRVRARFGTSIVVGFRQDPDVVDHAVLVEVEDGVLTDVQMAGPPSELLDPDVVGDGIEIASIEASQALREAADAWTAAVKRGVEPTPGIAANQRLVRRRISQELGIELDLFVLADGEIDTSRGMTADEIERADAAAVGTLRAAVGDPSGEAHAAWVEVVRGTIAGLTPREREGLLWLEWADWLGVGIGLLRGGADQPVHPEAFVDLINRCPEISSTVHADDRDYAEWAFDIALEHLVDHGLVDDERLTELGRSTLHASLVAAWSGSDQ